MICLIWIPFKQRFKPVLLNGTKRWTSRTKKYGKVGDIFKIFGATFVILEITKMTLQRVLDYHWREEGCSSRQDFIDVWEEIHPYKGFVPSQKVYVHIFQKVAKRPDCCGNCVIKCERTNYPDCHEFPEMFACNKCRYCADFMNETELENVLREWEKDYGVR